jgi:hypothetical protein
MGMTLEKAKEEIPDFETYAKICCDNCTANDWYCPSYCPELKKASSIPFNIIQEKYARYDGDLRKVVRYIKNTKRGIRI